MDNKDKITYGLLALGGAYFLWQMFGRKDKSAKSIIDKVTDTVDGEHSQGNEACNAQWEQIEQTAKPSPTADEKDLFMRKCIAKQNS